jgi:hypothetical protein
MLPFAAGAKRRLADEYDAAHESGGDQKGSQIIQVRKNWAAFQG